MSTYRELVNMILDQFKLSSDDAYFTEDHILFLLDKYRAMILKAKLAAEDKEGPLSEDNYQLLNLKLTEVEESDEYYKDKTYLRTKKQIPRILDYKSARIWSEDYYSYIMTFIGRDRMRHIGYNRFLKNIIYCSHNPNKHIYFKSTNEDYLDMNSVKLYALFENTIEAAELSGKDPEDILDENFPLEDSLVPLLIDSIVKMLMSAVYRPEDNDNTANDDLPDNYRNGISGLSGYNYPYSNRSNYGEVRQQ